MCHWNTNRNFQVQYYIRVSSIPATAHGIRIECYGNCQFSLVDALASVSGILFICLIPFGLLSLAIVLFKLRANQVELSHLYIRID